MIRFLLRFFGLLILAGGFVALVIDGTRTIAGNAVRITPLKDHWVEWHAASLQGLQTILERYIPWLWDPLMLNVLAAPTFAVLGVVGAFMILIGRKKRRLIGYARD
jgi:hypothetical protein